MREGRITASLRSRTRTMSMLTEPSTTTPQRAASRAIWAAWALATSALVGRHPVFTQVPPNRCRSTIATVRPAPRSRAASEGPACPAPTTTASKCVLTWPVPR
ncbi:Uncharacterised protein [Mycobacteroides abscessus subsp. abscessus]|nr:Uncharacterised protein [Mycobacteroides abscessus subsp. abscessus]